MFMYRPIYYINSPYATEVIKYYSITYIYNINQMLQYLRALDTNES